MRKTYEDARGNERCLVCHSKIEGGYCDCMLPEACDGITISTGKNVKKHREAIGISQRELGRRIDMTGQMISRIESDTTSPSIETIAKIAKVFNVNVSSLIDTNKYGELLQEMDISEQTKKVKQHNESIGKFNISVDTSDIDDALKKAKELIGVLQKIDGLTGRIVRDIDKINRYTLGR